MAYQLNRHHQRRKGGHRSSEVFQISDSRVFESLSLVVHKRTNRAAQWNHRHGRWGFKAGNHPNQVTQQNEKAECHQKGCESLAVMTDDFLALVFDKSMSALEDVL